MWAGVGGRRGRCLKQAGVAVFEEVFSGPPRRFRSILPDAGRTQNWARCLKIVGGWPLFTHHLGRSAGRCAQSQGGRVAGGFWTLWSPFQVERGCDESVRTGRKPSKRKASEVVGSETTRRHRAWLSRGQRGATARSWRPKRTHRCAAKRWLRCKSPPQTASTSGVAKWWFGQM